MPSGSRCPQRAGRLSRPSTGAEIFQKQRPRAISNFAYSYVLFLAALSVTGDRLRNRDLLALIDVAQALGDISDSAEFDAAILPLLGSLVAADSMSFNVIDLTTRTALRALVDPVDAYYEESLEILGAYAHQNPLIRARRPDAVRFSDYITRRELHRLEIYDLLYKSTETEYQMAFTVPAPDDRVIGFVFNRNRRDFSERDRSILNLVRGFVEQAHTRVHARLRLMSPQALGLTPRQAQVLGHLAAGSASAQIALAMQISERTVHKHLENIYARLEVTNRTAAVARATATAPR
jgi:DNA-binding CsgD family transcriptional regulator